MKTLTGRDKKRFDSLLINSHLVYWWGVSDYMERIKEFLGSEYTLKDLKKLSARKQGRVAERGRSGRERGILGSEPGGPSVTGWLRGATGAHIN